MIRYCIMSFAIAILIVGTYLYRYGKSDRFSWGTVVYMFIFPLFFWPVLVVACIIDDIRKKFFRKKRRKNKNKRTYDWSLVEDARMNSTITNELQNGSWIGEIDHPVEKKEGDEK